MGTIQPVHVGHVLIQMLALATLLVTVLTWSCGLRDMMFMLVLALVASAYGYRVRSLALFGVYGVVLMQVLHLQDAFLWLVCYEAATVLLLVTVLTLSAQ